MHDENIPMSTQAQQRMDEALPLMLREVRARGRRRRVRVGLFAAACLTPVIWGAGVLLTQPGARPAEEVVREDPVIHPGPLPERRHVADGSGPDVAPGWEPEDSEVATADHVISDDEFFRLMQAAGYDEVGLVRMGGKTIVVGYEPTPREGGGGEGESLPVKRESAME